MVNRMAPRTDPCGTPYFNSCGSVVDFLIWTVWVRPVRYDWNRSKTLPNDDSNEWSKRWWSIVSNAALRSSRTSIAPPWVSTAPRRSFWTRRRAVSVLCSWRYADWKTSYRWWAFRWPTSCTHTMCSISLDKKERFETCRKFFKISQSSMAFFRSGKTKALFNSGEKSANSREVLTTSVSTGVSSCRQSLRMDGGIGSREHDLLGEDDIIFRTSSWLTMWNLSRGTPSPIS